MRENLADDRLMVILAVTVIVICGMFTVGAEEVTTIVTHGLTALGSLAVGKAMGK